MCPKTPKYLEAQYECVRKGGNIGSRFPELSGNISNVWSDKHETFAGEHVADVISEMIGTHHIPITQNPETTSQERDIDHNYIETIKVDDLGDDKLENVTRGHVHHFTSTTLTSAPPLIKLSESVLNNDPEWRLEEVLVVVAGSLLSTVLLILTVALFLCKVTILNNLKLKKGKT